jgi:hypothetical protein
MRQHDEAERVRPRLTFHGLDQRHHEEQLTAMPASAAPLTEDIR